MAKRIYGSTPKQDGFRMPGEFEPQDHVFMIWPERTDNWRLGAKPAQKTFTNVAIAISKHTPITVLVNNTQYANARARLPENIRVVEMSSDDAWVRDCGPTFVINDKTGEIRGIDWIFNAWGGLVDGLYFPWANDDAVAQKICDLEGGAAAMLTAQTRTAIPTAWTSSWRAAPSMWMARAPSSPQRCACSTPTPAATFRPSTRSRSSTCSRSI